MQQKAYKAALEWYSDHGVDEALENEPQNARGRVPKSFSVPMPDRPPAKPARNAPQRIESAETTVLGQSDALVQSIALAKEAKTLDDLRQVIAGFDGISLKKTATNMVFSDGNPQAQVMLVGEAPGADEDRQGKPFVSVSGQLLDRILGSIGLSRSAEEPENSVYISNILNWRPPGNRTPSPSEIAVSLPFIERHIQLVQPRMLIFCGGVSAKALLGETSGISRLRKTIHRYLPQTAELRDNDKHIEALATYHPDYLLKNPGQKRAVWHDMCTLQAKLREKGE